MMMIKKLGGSLSILLISFILMTIAELFFIIDIVADVMLIDITGGLINHNTLEFLSVLLLAITLVALALQIKNLLAINRMQQLALQTASGKLIEIIKMHFAEWKLSSSEQEVAFLLIKGLSIQEIAEIRNTKAGTVKSQSNAIYQKSSLQNRAELTAFFVVDLLAGESIV